MQTFEEFKKSLEVNGDYIQEDVLVWPIYFEYAKSCIANETRDSIIREIGMIPYDKRVDGSWLYISDFDWYGDICKKYGIEREPNNEKLTK